ncbi:MAG: tryptophan synthase subunit alpha [Polyangiaceae bacterium]
MFARVGGRGEGVFVPFFVLGDPDLETSARLILAAVRAGADALEVGLPFSDPIADGPTLQRASLRALGAGATPGACFEMLASVRGSWGMCRSGY